MCIRDRGSSDAASAGDTEAGGIRAGGTRTGDTAVGDTAVGDTATSGVGSTSAGTSTETSAEGDALADLLEPPGHDSLGHGLTERGHHDPLARADRIGLDGRCLDGCGVLEQI